MSECRREFECEEERRWRMCDGEEEDECQGERRWRRCDGEEGEDECQGWRRCDEEEGDDECEERRGMRLRGRRRDEYV